MNTQELLTELQTLGVVLAAHGDRLSIDAPKGVITPAIRAELARHKAELLALLGNGNAAPDNGGAEAPSSPAAALDAQPVARKLATPKAEPVPWEGQRVRIENLADFKARWGLRVVGGDPDLQGQPWQPKLYLEVGNDTHCV